MKLGPFELHDCIGVGTAAHVFRALHRSAEVPAAVKIVTRDDATESDYQREFRDEVHALATLNHPSIADLYDYGRIEAPREQLDPFGISAGSPWFAMEYAPGGTLEEPDDDWSWGRFASVVRTLLDALAHAHANDVIHRDIKPSNILLLSRETDEASVALADFGIARLLDDAEADTVVPDQVRGTPKYMAPEQILGRRRKQGPWTDLYALGCAIWRMACNRAPLRAETTEKILRRHLRSRPDRFEPRFPVPEGFETWLRRLLAKKPENRYRRAADALAAFRQLDRERRHGIAADREEAPTIPPDAPTIALEGLSEHRDRSGVDHPAAEPPTEIPPLPGDWRSGTEEVRTRPLPRAGLSLLPLRKIPVVDRERERDRLWRALADTRETGRPQLVLIRGVAGAGKSRLAQWFARRAREVGSAIDLRIELSERQGIRRNTGDALAALFRTVGADREGALERVESVLERLEIPDSTRTADARGFVDMMGHEFPEEDAAAFPNRAAVTSALARLCTAVSRRRPLVIRLENVGLAGDPVPLIRALLDETDPPAPIVCVAAARRERLDRRPELRASWDDLAELEAAAPLELPPLGPDDQRRLVDRLVDLDPDLADRLVERTEGRPLFAVQLVEYWIEQGAISPGPDGFVLEDRAREHIPTDLHALWLRRLNQFAQRFEPEVRDEACRAFERAVVLGRDVREEEWSRLCDELELAPPADTIEQAIEAGLAEATDPGWRFEHDLLVESLRSELRERGGWSRLHRTCAEMLLDLYPERRGETARRRADHWLEAESPERAIEPLLEAAHHERIYRGYHRMRELLDRAGELIDDLGIPEEDARRIRWHNERSLLAAKTGSSGRAEENARRAKELAERIDDPRQQARATSNLGRVYRSEYGDFDAAIELYDRGIDLYEEAGAPPEQLAGAYGSKGTTFLQRGDLDAAERAFERAEKLARRADADREALSNAVFIRIVRGNRGERDRARSGLEELRERAREIGDHYQVAQCWNSLGEIARFRERWERAAECYRHAARHWSFLGVNDAEIARLNLALVETARENYARALEQWDEHERRLRRDGMQGRLRVVFLGRLVCHSGLEAWEAWDEEWERIGEISRRSDKLDRDHPWLALLAGDAAATSGRDPRARRTWEFGRRLAADLDADELLEEFDQRLG